ncbi:MAG TPA: DUF1206 domain-containing protein [Flavisolibacter sp.]
MEREKKRNILKALTLIGCFSTGIIYVSIGVIALLSFMRLKRGGADESSFFVLLNGTVAGSIVNWIIIAGAVCFIIWRFYEAFEDPYKVGNDAKGILLRTGAAFSSGADALIALSALSAVFSTKKAPVTGVPVQQREMVGKVLQWHAGHIVIIAIGVIILLTAIVLMLYGLSKRFTETIRSDDFSKRQHYIVHSIAYAGYFSRGVILGIIGFFFVKSAITNDANDVVNTDKAFNFIGEHIGHPWFILVAAGTISYGVYMFILGLHYDVSGDQKRQVG